MVNNLPTFCQYTSDATTHTISFKAKCNTLCLDQTLFDLKVTGFINRASTYVLSEKEVVFRTVDINGNYIDKISFPGTLQD